MKYKAIILLVSVLFFFNVVFPQIYVGTGPNAQDSDGYGLSPSTPYKTISYAVSAVITDNTTIYIATSSTSYNKTSQIYITRPLTLVKYGVGEVIIDGTVRGCPISDNYMLAIVNTNNVTVDGLTFQNYICNGGKAIWILGGGNNIIIKNCVVSNVGWTPWTNNTTQTSDNSKATIPIKVEGSKQYQYTIVKHSYFK